MTTTGAIGPNPDDYSNDGEFSSPEKSVYRTLETESLSPLLTLRHRGIPDKCTARGIQSRSKMGGLVNGGHLPNNHILRHLAAAPFIFPEDRTKHGAGQAYVCTG